MGYVTRYGALGTEMIPCQCVKHVLNDQERAARNPEPNSCASIQQDDSTYVAGNP